MNLRDKIGIAANVATVILVVLAGTLLVRGNLITGRREASVPSPSVRKWSNTSTGPTDHLSILHRERAIFS
jgi:hypothetical protein